METTTVPDLFVFNRVELKYLVSEEQKHALLERIGNGFDPDEHGRSTVNSLYLDTPDFQIIRASVGAISYKEKLRIRSYGTPGAEDTVFFELKKKLGDTVFKRRESMRASELEAYLADGTLPFRSQIMRELDYAMQFYHHPEPRCMICCEREAYFGREDRDLRITFDEAVRYRTDNLRLEAPSEGKHLLPDGITIMELKLKDAMPRKIAAALCELSLAPISVSKYGSAYRDILMSAGAETTQLIKEKRYEYL